MKFVSLFAGIGGFDLGLERAGHTCVGQVEIDDYATKVLEKHWPNVPRIRDVRAFQGTEFGPFDLLTGGYPCQPFSYGGKREGTNDERHLWPEVERIIRMVRPQFILMENVPGHLSLGFDTVLGSLAESGYDAKWDCIPASSIGANHQRDRLFFLAKLRGGGEMADSKIGDAGNQKSQILVEKEWTAEFGERHSSPRPIDDWWESEPNVGRVADGIPSRSHRLRTLGNAVVPQVAEWIARNWLPDTLSE